MTPAEIAVWLPPAQKRALLWLYSAPERVSFDERLSLLSSGNLVSPPFGWAMQDAPWSYSPLGLAVRAIVEREHDNEI